MTVDAWLQSAAADAEGRGLRDLKPILEGLARATRTLRDADFNDDASSRTGPGAPAARRGAALNGPPDDDCATPSEQPPAAGNQPPAADSRR